MPELETILTNASVEIDDETFTVEGNTLTFVEGQGVSSVRAATRGGAVVIVESEDVTTKVGMIKFETPSTINAINAARDIKALGSGRVVRISGTDAAGNRLGRTLSQGVFVTDPEKAVQNEGTMPMEFHGAPLTVS